MSKVVHLSDNAHRRAKEFCSQHGLKMSDWVATIIDEAVEKGKSDTNVRGLVPKRKILERLERVPASNIEEAAPVYSRPPFWKSRHG